MNSLRKKIIIEFSLALIIIGALFVGLVFFRSSIGKVASQILETRQSLFDRSVSINSLATFRKQYNDSAEKYLNVLRNVVPTKDDLIDFPKNVQTLANEENLGYGFSFLSETPAEGSALGSISFKVNIRGKTLSSLFKFVERLENFRYLTSINGIGLDKRSSDLDMEIRGQVFFRK